MKSNYIKVFQNPNNLKSFNSYTLCIHLIKITEIQKKIPQKGDFNKFQ